MIGLIGIKKNTPLEIRENLAVNSKDSEAFSKKLIKFIDGVVILSTCNRTEIYFNVSCYKEELLEKIFEVLNWDYNYKSYIFVTKYKDACRHLFEVTAGFHSKILGEDQILGQVKNAYDEALKNKTISAELNRLFQQAITCGKKFRSEARLFEIPVSSASIVVNEGIKRGNKRFLVLGYGQIGKLIIKYLLSHNVDIVYLAVRNIKAAEDIKDCRVKVIKFEEKDNYIDEAECIISCTAANYTVLNKENIKENGHKLLIYDLSVPRDVERSVLDIERVEMYNIDNISLINDENKKLRSIRMKDNKYILKSYLDEFYEWLKIRKVVPKIEDLKTLGKEISEKRIKTFVHKKDTKDNIELANMLIKSTSDFYINRFIEILKEDALNGSDEYCLKLIERILSLKK